MATPAPVVPRRRLGSLRGNSLPGGPKPPPVPAKPKYTCCSDPQVENDGEGHQVCSNCYTEISEANIVSEVTFSEDSRGAATVQGGFITENARHANTLGAAVNRATGGGERNTAQEIEKNARRALDKLTQPLGIAENTRNQAISIFTLACRNNFSAGRRTDEVAAACLYAACRRQRDNQVMLTDISELLQMNVFRLGEVYKAMCKDIHLQEVGGVGTQYLVEVESLVMKYCRKLEFGDATRQVAEDAVKIVRRMKRDWMVTGRHPAGLCGACIILAARMNNFRRSTREVVYVAKVADATVMKRVGEFRKLKAASLTVDQFREFGVRLKHQADPPVLYETQLKQMKFNDLRKKRHAASMARNMTDGVENGSVPADENSPPAQDEEEEERRKRRRGENGEPVTPPATQQELRRDADGFVIPPLPTPQPQGMDNARNQDQNGEPPKRKRGRPKKAPQQPIIITEEELADEDQLEMDINDTLNDDEVLDSRNDLEKAKSEERAKQLADLEKLDAAERTRARREAEGITWVAETDESAPQEQITPEDLEAEFANDPEVMNCLLSEPEQKVKEQIWVTHNEDWLRQQQEKKLIEAVAKSVGRTPQGRKKGDKPVKRKRKGKMGDGTTLAEATTPIETPADAARAMVDQRGANMSKYLNWDLLNQAFGVQSSNATSTRASSMTPSQSASRTATPSTRGNAAQQQRDTASPTPARSDAPGLPSPPITQQVAARAETPEASRVSASPAPGTPQTQAGADDDTYMQYDEDDDLDYGYNNDQPRPLMFGGDDDREDYEDDYDQAISGNGRVSNSGDYMDDDWD